MNIKQKVLVRFLVYLSIVCLIAGWFLWFQVRPSLIRKKCYKEASKTYSAGFNSGSELIKEGKYIKDLWEQLEEAKESRYAECFVYHGLKPEKLTVK